MAELRKTVTIDATPDAVWAVLGDLDATDEWLPGTTAARMEGSLRICETADGAEIREAISDYSAERRTYRFRHLQVPLPIENSSGTFQVEAGPQGRAVVVLEVSFDAVDPGLEAEIESMFGGALEQSLESLRRRVETGSFWHAAQVSPAARRAGP
jgi:uncharacterized protein YndB with AHSA1/START domain